MPFWTVLCPQKINHLAVRQGCIVLATSTTSGHMSASYLYNLAFLFPDEWVGQVCLDATDQVCKKEMCHTCPVSVARVFAVVPRSFCNLRTSSFESAAEFRLRQRGALASGMQHRPGVCSCPPLTLGEAPPLCRAKKELGTTRTNRPRPQRGSTFWGLRAVNKTFRSGKRGLKSKGAVQRKAGQAKARPPGLRQARQGNPIFQREPGLKAKAHIDMCVVAMI